MTKNISGVERMIPGQGPKHIEDDHMERYLWACQFVKGKTVLDVGCGHGYGCDMISAAGAKSIAGVDQFYSAGIAGATFYSVDFNASSMRDVLPRGETYDVVTCFEVIEHVENPASLLLGIYESMSKDGTLLISTPNSNISSPDSVIVNPFHTYEWTHKEFVRVLENTGFRVQLCLGQRHQIAPKMRILRKVYKTIFKPWKWDRSKVETNDLPWLQPEYMVFKVKKRSVGSIVFEQWVDYRGGQR